MASWLIVRITIVFAISTLSKQEFKKQDFLAQMNFLDEMSFLCPGAKICRQRNVTNSVTVSEDEPNRSCCMDCSCEDDCALRGNCCFKEFEPVENDTSCYYPHTEVDSSPNQYSAHRMVDKCPVQSINQNSNQSVECGDEPLFVWGSLHPIYSPDKDRIYKNEACARCHGVTDGVQWTIELLCRKVAAGIEQIMFLMFESFDEVCTVYFKHKGNIEDMAKHVCFIGVHDTCTLHPDEITVPKHTNLSGQGIYDACHSGLKSYRITRGAYYANIFCFLCDINKNFTVTSKCYLNMTYPRSTKGKMLLLIDAHGIGIFDNRLPSFIPYCLENETSSQDGQNCQETICPSGRMRINDQKCNFISKVWLVPIYEVSVRLITDVKVPIERVQNMFNYVTENNTLPPEITSPWGKRWKVNDVLFSEESSNNQTVLSDLIVTMRLATGPIRVKRLLDAIAASFAKIWQLNSQGSTITFRQEFGPYSFIRNNGTPNCVSCVSWDVGSGENGTLTYKRYTSTTGKFRSMLNKGFEDLDVLFVSQLYFCEQIKLSPDEITMHFHVASSVYRSGYSIYYKAENRFLQPHEFALVQSIYADHWYHICVPNAHIGSSAYQQKQQRITVVCLTIISSFYWLILSYA